MQLQGSLCGGGQLRAARRLTGYEILAVSIGRRRVLPRFKKAVIFGVEVS